MRTIIIDNGLIRSFSSRVIDPEKTKKKLAEKKIELNENNYFAHAEYFPLGENEKAINAEEYKQLKLLFDNLKQDEALTIEGKIIPNLTGKEYWLQKSGRWEKYTIGKTGDAYPAGAVIEPDAGQLKEISMQQEADRVAALSGEERLAEKETKLKELAREALRLRDENELMEHDFDHKKWFNEGKEKIELSYAV